MASCDNPQEAKKALREDWAVFEVIPRKDNPSATHCPSQKSKGIRTCDKCGLCDGTKNKHIQVTLH